MPTQSPSQNINSRYSDQASDGMLLGTSYTDERTGQADFFKDIIQRTAESFIDVGQANVAPLDRKEAGDRAKEYSGAFDGSKVTEAVFPLPTPSKQNESPMEALSAAPVVTPADHEMVRLPTPSPPSLIPGLFPVRTDARASWCPGRDGDHVCVLAVVCSRSPLDPPLSCLGVCARVRPTPFAQLENLVQSLGASVTDIRVQDVGQPLVASLPEI